MMRADYHSEAKTLQIALEDVDSANGGVSIGEPLTAAVVTLDGRPVGIDLLAPDLGVEGPLAEIARRYNLDFEELVAVARAALAAPDRPVTLDLGSPLAA
jgi:hypothetical protein